MTCKICGTRRARRFCPGVNGDICSLCCGTERENTVRCPLECVYLQEARLHEHPPEPIDPKSLPNQDIVVREAFIAQHTDQVTVLASTLGQAALQEPDAVDYDVREVLEALIRTYRTLQTGLYYDSRPENPIAARVFARFQETANLYREDLRKKSALHLSDGDILIILAFLQRVELDRNNGRRRGRAFIDFLHRLQPPQETPAQDVPSLIYPA